MSVHETVNPLVFTVYLKTQAKLPGKLKLGVWNLLQQWATRNDCPLQGRDVMKSDGWDFNVIVKRRYGPPRSESP